jgi:hypothetical protein
MTTNYMPSCAPGHSRGARSACTASAAASCSARVLFGPRDVEVVRQVGSALAIALRGLATMGVAVPGDARSPGTALYHSAGKLLSFDDQAHHWLTEIAGADWRDAPPTLSPVLAAVASAPTVAAGRERGPASTRIQAQSGRRIHVQASCLRAPDESPGPVAVTVGPAKSAQIAPIIVEACGLTPRERQITQVVARGMSNHQVAAAHHGQGEPLAVMCPRSGHSSRIVGTYCANIHNRP